MGGDNDAEFKKRDSQGLLPEAEGQTEDAARRTYWSMFGKLLLLQAP